MTVRHLGRFLEDPFDVPNVVLDYVASQIGVADPSCVKAYLERERGEGTEAGTDAASQEDRYFAGDGALAGGHGYRRCSGTVKMLCTVIEFGATADARNVLTAMAGLGSLLDAAPTVKVPKGYLDARKVNVDADGKLHLGKDGALDDRASLQDLRKRLAGMIPRVDLSEQVLELMSWHEQFAASFTSVTGSSTRLGDLHVSVAALLTARALNIGLPPVVDNAQALTRDRLAHVDQYYLRPENYVAANAVLIAAQAQIPLAQAWGGGMVAAVDGMRFVVPVRSVDARPNPKYFARKKGVTWLNMISDQSVGLAAMGKKISSVRSGWCSTL